MASVREQILDAFVAALSGTAQVGSRIYRSRADALAREEAPALVVRWDRDNFTGVWVSDKQERDLPITLEVYTRGAVPDDLADDILADAHAKIMANAPLRALAVDIYGTDGAFELEQADADAGFTAQQYAVKYRHKATDLTTQ